MRKMTRKRIEPFLQANASDMQVLDIGAGATAYQRFFPHRTTLDIDPARNPDIVADAQELPFGNDMYDRILCIDMLEHTLDPGKVIDECHRILKPGGKLIFATRFVYPFHDAPGDYWRFTRSSLERIFSKFPSVEVMPEGSEMFTLGVLLQRIVLQCDVRGGKVTKAFLLFLAWLCEHSEWLVSGRYGDIRRTVRVPEMMASGYYIVARK